MATKLRAEIHKRGENNNNLLTIIAAHNGGQTPVALDDLISYATIQRALYPAGCKGFQIVKGEDEDDTVLVSEDGGETYTLTIWEIELLTMEEVIAGKENCADDLKNIF